MTHDVTITPLSGSNPHADRKFRVRCTCGLRPLLPMTRDDAKDYRDRHIKATSLLKVVGDS